MERVFVVTGLEEVVELRNTGQPQHCDSTTRVLTKKANGRLGLRCGGSGGDLRRGAQGLAEAAREGGVEAGGEVRAGAPKPHAGAPAAM